MKKSPSSGFRFIVISTLSLLTGTGQAQTTIENLGAALFFDKNLSLNRNQACSSCHDLGFGLADPDNVKNGTPVSAGSITTKSGTLNAPSGAYAAFSPFFHWDDKEKLYVGGQFWNGRASTLAEQAAGPFLNPVEMAMPDKWSVVERLRTSTQPNYQTMFAGVYGIDLSVITPYTGDYVTPVAEVNFPAGVREVYKRMANAIGEFEKTELFNRFNSKFDYYLAGLTTLSKQEENGLKLFNGQGKCNLCHPSEPAPATDGVSQVPPLFTDFTYDNLGLPQNVNIPGQPIDQGLGGRQDIAANDPQKLQTGKHKVMTLRNIEFTPPYGHNGVFATLEQIVHFYNTRDTLEDVCKDNNDPGFAVTCWPAAEVSQNVNFDELGDLKLTAAQEADIITFMKTLSDGWGPANDMPTLPRPTVP